MAEDKRKAKSKPKASEAPTPMEREGLHDLVSGAYDPRPIMPQTFRGSTKPYKEFVVWSALSPEALGPMGRFDRPTRQGHGFKKGPLGEYETIETVSMLGPSEVGLPPQKVVYSPGQRVQDWTAGFIGGMGSELATLGAIPRTLADLVTERNTGLPTAEQIGEWARGFQRFVPMTPEAMARIGIGPQTPGGEYAAQVGGFVPYVAGGAVPALRKFVPFALSGQSFLP